jgi:Putative zinc-finger
MRPPVPTHPDDDQLLELAYGEVPASEARALRQHVDGCARCRKVLDGIAEVRTAFRSIPDEPAPEKGLESLLAYGEQAAARARSRRGGLRILALLSAATAFAVVWLMLPGPSKRSDTDVLAQAEVPHEAVQGTRARDEADPAKDTKENEAMTPRRLASPKAQPAARMEQFSEEQPAAGRQSAAEPLAKQKASEKKLDAPREQPKLAEAPADRESEAQSGASGNLSGALGSAAGGKAGSAVGPSPASGVGALAAKSSAGAEKKRSSGAHPEDSTLDGTAKAPSTPPAALAATPPAANSGDDLARLQTGKVAAAPRADTMASEDKAAAVADAVSAPAASPPAKAAKPVPPMQSVRVGAGSPDKQARLTEIRRHLETAKGEQRKGLLLEKCEIEASLELRTDAVLTCSTVSREFPGTPEAKRASDLARGFSLQLPTGSER